MVYNRGELVYQQRPLVIKRLKRFWQDSPKTSKRTPSQRWVMQQRPLDWGLGHLRLRLVPLLLMLTVRVREGEEGEGREEKGGGLVRVSQTTPSLLLHLVLQPLAKLLHLVLQHLAKLLHLALQPLAKVYRSN